MITRFKTLMLLTVIMVTTFFPVQAFAEEEWKLDYVIHAAGAIGEDVGTNSLEGVKSCFFNGYRYIELDFSFTTDNHLVAIHDWETDYFLDGSFSGAVSLEEFKTKKILGKYTPVTLDILESWIAGKPETYIITDIKERNVEGLKYIKDNYPVLADRIIPQIYNETEYEPAREMGYGKIVYTLYALSYDEKTNVKRISAFVKEKGIDALVFSTELATKEYVSSLKSSGANLLCHTVNDKEEQAKYKEMGVGVYSDFY